MALERSAPNGAGESNSPRLTNVIRLDSMPIAQASFTPEGYLKDRPILTSTGIFEYHEPDGSVRRELRLPEDVFDPDSLASYRGKPVIITHDAGLVTKENVHQFQIGTILTDGYRSGDDVRAEIIIHDTDAMKQAGLKELSLGYNLDLEETPGVWNGQKYDAIQRNIQINHLALVREARAGEQARLNIDSRDQARPLKGGKASMKKTATKKAKRNDGVLSPEELKKAIEEYKARRAKAAAPKTDGDDDATENPVVSAKPQVPAINDDDDDDDNTVVAPAGQDTPSIEDQVKAVKGRRDSCKADADDKDESEEDKAKTIAQMDEDMGILFDIIDTLLAEREFDSTDDEKEDPDATNPFAEDEDDEEAEVPGQQNEDGDDEDDEENPVPEDENADEDDDEDDDKGTIPAVDPDNIKPRGGMNADSVDAIVRQRIQLGMVGRALNMDGLENMSIKAAKKAVVKCVRPSMNLDGKSSAFINAAYGMAVDEVNSRMKKDTRYQKRQMFNGDSRSYFSRNDDSSMRHRERMMERQKNHKKEDK